MAIATMSQPFDCVTERTGIDRKSCLEEMLHIRCEMFDLQNKTLRTLTCLKTKTQGVRARTAIARDSPQRVAPKK